MKDAIDGQRKFKRTHVMFRAGGRGRGILDRGRSDREGACLSDAGGEGMEGLLATTPSSTPPVTFTIEATYSDTDRPRVRATAAHK